MGDFVLPERRSSLEQAFFATHGIASLSRDLGPLLVAVGVFDGLHRGHLYLLRQLRHAARQRGSRPAVITFDAHPREIISGAAPPQLCDPDERLVRLGAAGVEVTVVQHFDTELRETTYQGFVEMIRDHSQLSGFVMTPEAAFGYQRQGTPDALRELGLREGFDVVVAPALMLDGRPISSTEIRRAIATGDLGQARHLLGRSLSVVGERMGPDGIGPSGGTSTRLTFAMPVALPPAGRYLVGVGRPWTVDAGPESATMRALAVVTQGRDGIELRATATLPPGERLRLVFQRRLGAPAAAGLGASEASFARRVPA